MVHYNSLPQQTCYDSLDSYNELSRLHSYEPNLCVMGCPNLTQGGSNSTTRVCTKIQPHCFSLTTVHKLGASSEILFRPVLLSHWHVLLSAADLIMKLQSEIFPLLFLTQNLITFCIFLYSKFPVMF
jgi:hypothetical protein